MDQRSLCAGCFDTVPNRDTVVGRRTEHFADLVMSPESQQLRNIFFATTQMKKADDVDGCAANINKVGILGGGLMGGGIAYVTSNKAKVPARIKDISHQGRQQGGSHLQGVLRFYPPFLYLCCSVRSSKWFG